MKTDNRTVTGTTRTHPYHGSCMINRVLQRVIILKYFFKRIIMRVRNRTMSSRA